MSLSADQESKLTQFCSFTGAEINVAKAFLKATGWDVNTATDRYFAFDGDASKLAPPANNNRPQLNNNNAAAAPSIMSSTASIMQQALGNFFGAQQPQQQIASQPQISNNPPNMPNASNLSQTDQDALLAQQLAAQSGGGGGGAPYVRAPDQAYQERLIGPYGNQFGSSYYKQKRDKEENFAKDWQKGPRNQKSSFLGALFSDPGYKFAGSLEDAKKKGSRENKWLLVNIQDTENFCSHCLNRDIWKDKDLSPVIEASFIFYQWTQKTDNAKRLINLYHPTSFPCIFILDPNTGRHEFEFAVPDSPDKISQLKPKLLEFLDDYPNPKAKPKRIPKSIPTKALAPQSHDDMMIQQAIQASLNETKENELDTDNVNDANSNSNGHNKNGASPMEQDTNEQQEEQEQEQAVEVEPEPKLEEQLDPQPESGDPNSTAIRVRMPNGSILQRLFKKDAKVNQLYIWCKLSLNGKDISLLQTMPRLKLDEQKDKTLKELGLIRATLVCSYED